MTQEFFLLVRRKPSSASTLKLFTIRSDGREDECFRLNKSLSDGHETIYLSLPYLKKCYHMAISNRTRDVSEHKFENFEQPIDSISLEILHGVLSSLGVIDFSCASGQDGLVLANHSECVQRQAGLIELEFKRFDVHFDTNYSEWLSAIRHALIARRFKLVLHSYTEIRMRLEVSCLDRLSDLVELVEQCMRFYGDESCQFKCTSECDSRQSVWQLGRFGLSF